MELNSLLFLLVGLAGGCIVTALLYRQKLKSIETLEEARKGDQAGMEKAFESLSYAALKESTSEFLKLAKQTLSNQTEAGEAKLDEKKKLIDARLETMGKNLDDLLKETVKLKTGLTSSQTETNRLRETTEDLRNVLSSSQARGQWGEKMVEDILNLVGLVEHINFVKQKQLESGPGRPDFTFLLPSDKKVNLDAKFPLAHYERFIAADDEEIKKSAKKNFLTDVKNHIKAVAGRNYISPEDNTVDYVLVFIPNESIYAFIHQSDPAILDFALEKRIILCSPITLYAVVSLIHQAVSDFVMEERAEEIMKLLGEFQNQWDKFKGVLKKMGNRIADTQREFADLTSTRTNMLEKSLDKIESIRSQQESEPEALTEDSTET